MKPGSKLVLVKLLHTAVWAVFAAAIFLIPVFARFGHLKAAVFLIGFVMVEVLILGLNRFSCPLTAVAGRYTAERKENFDIYLPLWLAKYNDFWFAVPGGLRVYGNCRVAGLTASCSAPWNPSSEAADYPEPGKRMVRLAEEMTIYDLGDGQIMFKSD